MLTFQDFQTATDKTAFILKAINEHKKSDTYSRAKTAQSYYERNNNAIANRLTFMEKYGISNSKVKFFKQSCGFFPRMCKQLTGYLLGNGITLPQEIKNKLGVRFDKDFKNAGLQALIDGVNWCFWNVDRLVVFRATEFVPLFDETNGDLMAGIRFWQIDREKPLNVELYEVEGITRFVQSKADGNSSNELTQIGEKATYINSFRRDAISEEVIDSSNYPRIPVFAFYANELKSSELTSGLKEDIDAYDFINSDLTDSITQIEGIYWIVKNYGGSELTELREDLHKLKMLVEESDSKIDSHNLEVPHKAKQVALELLEKSMFNDTMSLDMKSITGGSLTNVAINVAKTDLDLKADLFEQQAEDVILNILELLGITAETPRFKRRTITNDTETVNNISTMISDRYVDVRWAIDNNPLIADEDHNELFKRVELERTGIPSGDTQLDEEVNENG